MKNPFSSFWAALKGTFRKSNTAGQAGEGCSIAAATGDEAMRLRGTAAPWTRARAGRARARRHQWGFTLIELLVVVAIIAVIAAFIVGVLK